MRSITIDELERDTTIHRIDIRDPYSFRQGTIPLAKNIPYLSLISSPHMYINTTDTYCIFCEYGITSERACQILEEKGYDVRNLYGGYQQYIQRKKLF